MSSAVVLQDVSPNGNVRVVVDQDERVVYAYVQAADDTDFTPKACWIRNITQAPERLDVDGMKQGVPPMLPVSYCKDPSAGEPFDEGQLQAVWFEEGDGVAIMEQDQILAIIPAWAGEKGFDGFARDCIGQSPLCWELESDNVLFDRVRKAQEYWQSWDQEPTPWQSQSDKLLAEIESQLGEHSRYFAIDGGEWPPKALVLCEPEGAVVLASIGVSLRPQPAVEMLFDDPEQFARFELAFAFDSKLDTEKMLIIGDYISGQSNLPWGQYTWLGHGHTVPCREFGGLNAKMTSMLLVASELSGPDLRLSPYRGDAVNVLWCVPITDDERDFAVNNGSAELVSRLEAADVGRVYQDRACTIG